jgi:hypothetical protein
MAVYTKSSIWYGKAISFKTFWCEVMGQEWTEKVIDDADDLMHSIRAYLSRLEEYPKSPLERETDIMDSITDMSEWKGGMGYLMDLDLKITTPSHDQVEGGYFADLKVEVVAQENDFYILGLKFDGPVPSRALRKFRKEAKPFLVEKRLPGLGRLRSLCLYTLQDACLCCT